MINWVHQACKDWGRAQWYLMFGKSGYPTSSSIARFTEAITHSNVFTMEYPECLMGDNLITANAIKTLPELPRAVISVHYVLRLPARTKYRHIGITRDLYYETISAAHLRLANVIDAQGEKSSGQVKTLWSRLRPTMA